MPIDSLSYMDLLQQRNEPGEAIYSAMAEQTRLAFDRDNGLPVVIPTYNEASDLPLALVALARSTVPVHPIVVDSTSTDSTAEFASEMGATVLQVDRGQMLGYKSDMEYVQQTRGASPLLITDADCLPQARWAETLTQKAHLTPLIGGIAFGTTIFHEGPSRTADIVRSMYAVVGDFGRLLLNRTARMRGSNCHVQLDENGKILERVLEHEDRAFPCDVLLGNTVMNVTGVVVSVNSPRTIMLSKGDRYVSIDQLAKIFWGEKTGGVTRLSLYGDHDLQKPATK